MTELPADTPEIPPADPAAETQVHIPEFRREPDRSVPWLGIGVIFILAAVGMGLLTFALVYGQGESENRAINATVAAVLSFTDTPTSTRAATSTPVATFTPAPPTEAATDTPAPSDTPTEGPSATLAASATNTRPPTNTFAPVTPTPAPPTHTPAPAFGSHGVSGSLQLCNPGKTTYAAKAQTTIGLIEQVCIIQTIRNHTDQQISYGILGVFAANTSGGPSQFQTSWRGDLKINGNCTGPSGEGGCGGAHTDTGFYIDNPGSYILTLRICYSSVDVCLGDSGDWETLTGGIPIEIISWTPSP